MRRPGLRFKGICHEGTMCKNRDKQMYFIDRVSTRTEIKIYAGFIIVLQNTFFFYRQAELLDLKSVHYNYNYKQELSRDINYKRLRLAQERYSRKA